MTRDGIEPSDSVVKESLTASFGPLGLHCSTTELPRRIVPLVETSRRNGLKEKEILDVPTHYDNPTKGE